MAVKPKPKPSKKTEKPEKRGIGDPSRWTEPFWVDTRNMTPEELARSEAFDEAHRAALRGDFEPGIKLGLFPKDMKNS